MTGIRPATLRLGSAHQLLQLAAIEHGRLAGGAADHHAIGAFAQVEIEQGLPRDEINRPVVTHGRDECRDAALEHGVPSTVDDEMLARRTQSACTTALRPATLAAWKRP